MSMAGSSSVAPAEYIVLGSGDVQVLFCPETLHVFIVDPRTAAIMREARLGSDHDSIAQSLGTSVGDIQRRVEAVTLQLQIAAEQAYPSIAKGPFQLRKSRTLPKAVFMVNNYCNLACPYCYEHETIFKDRSQNMSENVALASLEKFYGAFQEVQQIMFIGGEPTLSESAIGYICEQAGRIALERGAKAPKFGMITNGARITEPMFQVISKYRIQLTFSLDGPAKVNDLVRIHKDGSGSFKQVTSNLKRYASEFPDLVSVECTLTSAHEQQGYTVTELSDFFARELGVEETHIAAAGLPSKDPRNPYRNPGRLKDQFEEAALQSVQEVVRTTIGQSSSGPPKGRLDMASTMLRRLLNRRRNPTMCPAGVAQLVVDVHGDLYPCWMFAGVPAFKMGNLLTDDLFGIEATRVLDRIDLNSREKNLQCSTCFARNLCSACIGNNHNSSGSMEIADERFCETIRGAAETVILEVGRLKANPHQWNQFKAATQSAVS